jgi:uncharacterized protein YbjQ (UPF0145 family)
MMQLFCASNLLLFRETERSFVMGDRHRTHSKNRYDMIVTTTNSIEGRAVSSYLGVISSEVIIGANIFKDILGGLRDVFGGRSGTYERVMEEAKENAIRELQDKARAMGADAILGVDLDFETIGGGGTMLMVSASGTAVRLA